MRAFEQFSDEKGASLALVGLACEPKFDREDAAHDCSEEHTFSDQGIRNVRNSSGNGTVVARFLADAVNRGVVRR